MILDDALAATGLVETRDALVAYRDLLSKWNQRINLTAARTDAEIEEHIADCLYLVEHARGAARLIDVGSGGGLPAIVLAICLRSTHVVALEPVHKKHAFLRTASRELGLANLEPLAQRHDDHPTGDYDVATSRATMDLVDWLAIGATLVRFDGRVLGMEGKDQIALPENAVRHTYDFGGKTRAIIVLTRRVTFQY
jgi:16S rRNA (guanine527-N7)-methyltransferase